MNFYEFAEILKKQNPNKIVIIKTGAFFNCIGKDAIIAEKQLGLKRTCFAKGICKCGMPVQYWRKHIENIKKEAKQKNIGIIIYDEVKGGNFKYKEKEYGIILDENGEYKEEQKQECTKCTNNQYYKEKNEMNKYTIEKEEFEKLKSDVKKILYNIEKLFEIFGR